jgi:hypothetical protein
MTTLHIFRNEPDEQVRELVRESTQDESSQIALYEETVDYVRLIDSLFSHDRVISWW